MLFLIAASVGDEKKKIHIFWNPVLEAGGLSATSPGHFTAQEREPVPTVQDAEWASGPV